MFVIYLASFSRRCLFRIWSPFFHLTICSAKSWYAYWNLRLLYKPIYDAFQPTLLYHSPSFNLLHSATTSLIKHVQISTDSKELSPSWEANIFSVIKDFFGLFETQQFITVFTKTHNMSLPSARWFQFILVHSFLEKHFNNINPSTPSSYLQQSLYGISLIVYAYCTSHLNRPLLFDRFNSILRGIWRMT